MTTIKCTRCKVDLSVVHFSKKRNDTYYKLCNECRIKTTSYQRKHSYSLCIHGHININCVECMGANVCKHKQMKFICDECNNF